MNDVNDDNDGDDDHDGDRDKGTGTPKALHRNYKGTESII